MAFVVVREPGRLAFTVAIAGTCTIGRGGENDIVLADGTVSRTHARIVAVGGGHAAEDLESRHGTFVNGTRVDRHALCDGDQLQVGKVILRYRDGTLGDGPVIDSVAAIDETAPAVGGDAAARRMRLLQAVAKLIGAGGERDELARSLLEQAVSGLDGEGGVVGLVDGRGGMRQIACGRRELVLPRAVIDALVGRKESILVAEGGGHAVGAPLLAAGRAFGIVYVTRAAPPFGVTDRAFLDIAAHLTAAALTQSEREGRLERVAEALRAPAVEIVGNSAAMVDLRARLERYAAAHDTAILIRGESGTGKGLVARTIHSRSRRAGGPFVAVNCAAIPDTLIESELFGHDKGAFTGAARALRGKFALAHSGTLFLDEVGELSAAAQAKLLRAIEDREIQPLGSEEPFAVDVRVLSATNKRLEEEIAAGRFRADLYYRLAVAELIVPPLRERGDDVILLAEMLAARTAGRLGRPTRGFTPEARALLARYPWPGNVRQLANEIERALLLTDDELLELDDLRARFNAGAAAPGTLADAEREVVERALGEAGGNIRAAARTLGMSRNALYRKIAKYGLSRG